MDKARTEIALVYTKKIGWIGGTYYIQNIISALNTLVDNDKPILNIYCGNKTEFEELKSNTGYKYLIYNEFILKETLKDKINKIIDFYHYKATNRIDIESTNNVLIYPFHNPSMLKGYNKQLAWIADFQSRYFPKYFTWRVRYGEYRMQTKYDICKVPVVLSSQDALDDYHKFYPNATNKTYVLRFAVTHPDFSMENIEKLQKKFGITKKYFFCANQFWKHKNHLFLFKAFKKIKERGANFQLVCSGALHEPRFHNYIKELKDFIKENNLECDIKILGFIERTEQLCLMKNSYAIIQPSLFEGWSTVVEDAKALNKFIFLSSLRVNIEQAPLNVCYFDPYDEDGLVYKLQNTSPTDFHEDYDKKINKFAENFMSIVEDYKKNLYLK
jgi:glycosyltransferase involved in cell wall biosynthesis